MKIKGNEKYEFYSIQLQCHSTSHSTQANPTHVHLCIALLYNKCWSVICAFLPAGGSTVPGSRPGSATEAFRGRTRTGRRPGRAGKGRRRTRTGWRAPSAPVGVRDRRRPPPRSARPTRRPYRRPRGTARTRDRCTASTSAENTIYCDFNYFFHSFILTQAG